MEQEKSTSRRNIFKNWNKKSENVGYEDIHYSCSITFLDESEPLTLTFQKRTMGRELIDQVCTTLDLMETDYFGLHYLDDDNQKQWMDSMKPVCKQIKGCKLLVFCFGVRYYPSDPMKLKEEITRYYLFLQLVSDLRMGKLFCSADDMNLLVSYIAQARLGDFDEEVHGDDDYILRLNIIPDEVDIQLNEIIELHKGLSGLSPPEAEALFLQLAARLDSYGLTVEVVKDEKGNRLEIGITYRGIITYSDIKDIHLLRWSEIAKLDYEGKHFLVYYHLCDNSEVSDKKRAVIRYKCATVNVCKSLWKYAMHQRYFFTLKSSNLAHRVTGGGCFLRRRRSTISFNGRSEAEAFLASMELNRDSFQFTRSMSNLQFVRSRHSLDASSLPAQLRHSTEDEVFEFELGKSPPQSTEKTVKFIDIVEEETTVRGDLVSADEGTQPDVINLDRSEADCSSQDDIDTITEDLKSTSELPLTSCAPQEFVQKSKVSEGSPEEGCGNATPYLPPVIHFVPPYSPGLDRPSRNGPTFASRHFFRLLLLLVTFVILIEVLFGIYFEYPCFLVHRYPLHLLETWSWCTNILSTFSKQESTNQ